MLFSYEAKLRTECCIYIIDLHCLQFARTGASERQKATEAVIDRIARTIIGKLCQHHCRAGWRLRGAPKTLFTCRTPRTPQGMAAPNVAAPNPGICDLAGC
jgi:hypothetical protein